MSKHTPGPWQIIGGYNIYSQLGGISGDGSTADPSDGWHIASAGEAPTFSGGYEIFLGRAVVRANIALIAAAPDLLEALEYCLDCLGDEFALPADCQSTARAAIAKVRGEA